jgi:molecular chaperone GrpE
MAEEENVTEEFETTSEAREASAEPQESEAAEELPPPTLEEQLAEAREQVAEYLDGWQRARAELANFRRRTEAQRAEMVITANAELLAKLLPVLDDLQLALTNSPREAGGALKEWRNGLALIVHKFSAILEEAGVVPIETEGLVFDPNVHEAISHEKHPDFESGQIIEQVRHGYRLGTRVLRAAVVRVAQ